MEVQFFHPEFEHEVRSQLNIFERAITDSDLEKVMTLELYNFDFPGEDREVLFKCRNLKYFGINIGYTTPEFWSHFPQMHELYIVCWGDQFDFESFRFMPKLKRLFVSGGDSSAIPYVNLETLLDLHDLSSLTLHEFGTVDISPLAKMKQMKSFGLKYANEVDNIDAIGSMSFLKHLELDGLYLDNLDFLDTLPDTLEIEMCGIHLFGGADVRKWKRFTHRDISEISAGDKLFNYIDLSALYE